MLHLPDAAAPVSRETHRPLLSSANVAFATIALFTVFGSNALRNLLTWWGFSAIVVALLVVSAIWIARSGTARSLRRLPRPLLLFVAFALLSTLWSNWRLETLAGTGILLAAVLLAVPLALLISWEELLAGFSAALRWIIGLSLIFELIVSTIIRHPVLPLWIDWETAEDAPLMLLWSRNLLFVDGKIQGVLGNSSMLASVALLALIAVCLQLVTHRMGRIAGSIWIVLIVGTLALTRSATVTIAGVVVLAALVVILLRRRVTTARGRVGFYATVITIAAVVLTAIAIFWSQILGLFGKSDDLTGRVEIWNNTIGLAQQRPVLGWGWVGYWPPWVEPLGSLNERYGVVQLHAHDSWIDLWMQVGIVGLVIFALFVLVTTLRSARSAIHPAWHPVRKRLEFSAVSLFPALVMVMFLVQNITESRFLVEEGLLMLCILGIKLKLDPFVPDEPLVLYRSR